MKESFAPDLDQNSVFFSEVTILKCLEHEGIVNLKGSGTDGIFIHPNGDVKEGICYIVTEYIQHNLFDFCKTMGGMGEEAGKFFLHQIINVAEYIHQKGIAHRDIKLENILLDSQLNLKLLDFGLSSQKNIESLRDQVGTDQYMAPEIHAGKVYHGAEIDMFSIGVILFQIVQGTSPFFTAT